MKTIKVDLKKKVKKNICMAMAAIVLSTAMLGAGYYLGGSRPNLEKVFEMTPDTFETATKDAEGEAQTAAKTIKKEIKALNSKTYEPKADAKNAFEAKVNAQTLADDHEAMTAQKSAKETFDAFINFF